MDRALPAETSVTDPLAASALLLGGALGLMGFLAMALLLLTTRFGG